MRSSYNLCKISSPKEQWEKVIRGHMTLVRKWTKKEKIGTSRRTIIFQLHNFGQTERHVVQYSMGLKTIFNGPMKKEARAS